MSNFLKRYVDWLAAHDVNWIELARNRNLGQPSLLRRIPFYTTNNTTITPVTSPQTTNEKGAR